MMSETDDITDSFKAGADVAVASASGMIQSLAIVAVPLLMLGLGTVIAVALISLPAKVIRGGRLG
jgi:hypothetical protein